MAEKYLLSVCFTDHRQEIFSEPFGPFDTFLEAECFADKKIDELRFDFIKEFGHDGVDEYFEFDFTIKRVFLLGKEIIEKM